MFPFVMFVFIVPTLLCFWIFWEAAGGRLRRALLPALLLIGASSFAVIGLLEMPEDAAGLAAVESTPLRLRVLGEIEQAVKTMQPVEAGGAVRRLAGEYSPEHAVELHPYAWRKTADPAVGAAVILAAAALGAYKFRKVRRLLFCAALCALECALAVFIFAAQYDSARNIAVMRNQRRLTKLAEALERSDLSQMEVAALVMPQIESNRSRLPHGGLADLQMAALDLLQAEGRSSDDSN